MPVVRIPQLKKEIQVSKGANLMESLLDNQIPVASSCHGDGVCAKCRMALVSSPEAVNSSNETEVFLREKFKLATSQRISCQVQVLGDLEVQTSYW